WLESKPISNRKFFGLTYISMLVWNVTTTWWIWNASAPGAVGAFLANSLLMCLPWLGFRITKKKLGNTPGYLSLIVFWMAFEYIHLQDWGLSWPWLTLGNIFATHTEWIQWYEYTGVSGGTFWILLVNIFLYLHVYNNFNRQAAKSYKHLLIAVLLLILPVAISLISSVHKTIPGIKSNIVVVQPNIDPYEKISDGTFETQLQKLIQTSETQIDSSTALLVWPETALFTPNGIEEDKMKENEMLAPLWEFLKKYPGVTLFTGVESFKRFDQPTKYSQQYNGQNFEDYNGSVLMDSSGTLAFYHKSMLVPGVETLPWFLKFIDKWFEKFGGTTAGYAKQSKRTVLDTKKGYKIAPAICYESIYGEYMSSYIRNGANIICIITNDGWWGNTPGYKQHMNYGRLRAIETRKWVVRSANTGISCFIDIYGFPINQQPWNKTAAIKLDIPVSNGYQTFFVRNGDILSKAAVAVSILFLILNLVYWVKRKFISKNN
ncbi:MAG: apolipoprotein N-acyltransferase, partial [Bacteroidota bacterium]